MTCCICRQNIELSGNTKEMKLITAYNDDYDDDDARAFADVVAGTAVDDVGHYKTLDPHVLGRL